MKITLIADVGGNGPGAVLGAFRVYEGLKALGHQVKMLVGRKEADDPNIEVIRHNTVVEKVIGKFTANYGLNYIQYFTTKNVSSHPFFQQADVINYHNLTGGFFNYRALPALTALKPSVMKLTSMWAFTGHCNHALECQRWKTGCGKCPRLDAYPAANRDATALEYKLKRTAFQNSHLHLVSTSHWLINLAKQGFVGELPIHHIPNGINIRTFAPQAQDQARAALGIPLGKQVVLFASYDLSKMMKGSDYVIETMNALPPELQQNTVLLLMGNNPEAISNNVGVQCVAAGFVSDEAKKTAVYSAADVMLYPTRADTFSNIVLECLASGTPVVAFRVGGVPDMVRQGITGALADPPHHESLTEQLRQFLENPAGMAAMRAVCRRVVEEEFSVELQIQRYVDTFQLAIDTHPTRQRA